MENAEIVERCMEAVNNRDARIAEALDIIESAMQDAEVTDPTVAYLVQQLNRIYDSLIRVV